MESFNYWGCDISKLPRLTARSCAELDELRRKVEYSIDLEDVLDVFMDIVQRQV